MNDNTSVLYQILEDVYNASSLCRPDIEYQHTANKTSANNQITVNGVLAPTILKNYHILSKQNQNVTIPHSKTNRKKLKRPLTACSTLRSRTFYKNSKQIANKCIRLQQKRIRPNSAPLKKSQSVSNMHKTTKKLKSNHNKLRNQRPYSAKLRAPGTMRSYCSTSTLIFKPIKNTKYRSSTLQMKKYNEKRKNFASHDQPSLDSNNNDTSQWMNKYIKDKKEKLHSLDEFAKIKIADLDLKRLDCKKRQRDRDKRDGEFDSIIPDVDQLRRDDNPTTDNMTKFQHNHDNSIRVAMYIDLLSMIANNISQHSQLLQFLSCQIAKYVFKDSNFDVTQTTQNNATFSKLCKLSTCLDNANYYKQKYQALLKETERAKHKQQAMNKLIVIEKQRKDRIKTYFIEWRLLNSIKKFKIDYKARKKKRYFKKWKQCYYRNTRWDLESKIGSLENDLIRNEIYRELYVEQNGELVHQLTQFKEAIANCVDAANQNDKCHLCSSSWHKQFHDHLSSIKLRHTFLKDLL